MAAMILIGNIETKGDASEHLIKNLTGLELPLAGIATVPYLPGQEILSNFEKLLNRDGFCYLVSKFELMQALALISPRAAAEVQVKYPRLDYLPFCKESCHLISHHAPKGMH
jgi:hypothetical protein